MEKAAADLQGRGAEEVLKPERLHPLVGSEALAAVEELNTRAAGQRVAVLHGPQELHRELHGPNGDGPPNKRQQAYGIEPPPRRPHAAPRIRRRRRGHGRRRGDASRAGHQNERHVVGRTAPPPTHSMSSTAHPQARGASSSSNSSSSSSSAVVRTSRPQFFDLMGSERFKGGNAAHDTGRARKRRTAASRASSPTSPCRPRLRRRSCRHQPKEVVE